MALKSELKPECFHVVEGRGVTFAKGFKSGSVWAGLKSKTEDLVLIVSDKPASAAGVFTTNLLQASSVTYSRKIITTGRAQAIFCNAGNANACNGEQGDKDNLQCAQLSAKALGLETDQVLVASTGVIGRLMPMEKIEAGVPLAASALVASAEIDERTSKAILTTDTRPKMIAVEVNTPGWAAPIRIGGITKGSGMIAPNMATTLGFITTDAQIEPQLLQMALWKAIEKSYNRITVDGDTSTNDMVLVLANGASGNSVTSDSGYDEFYAGLEHVLQYLAKEIARDGEGATKLVSVTVKGAESEQGAQKIAKTIAESPLVKTALFGSDPNWGRIMAAAGRAGVPFNPTESSVWLGEYQVFAHGTGTKFDNDGAHAYLKSSEVDLVVTVGRGTSECTYWTCDYSYDYIKINAEYHT
jgi:glutamate N-acetyltransferase / amino-acid N-acetyltransferase